MSVCNIELLLMNRIVFAKQRIVDELALDRNAADRARQNVTTVNSVRDRLRNSNTNVSPREPSQTTQINLTGTVPTQIGGCTMMRYL